MRVKGYSIFKSYIGNTTVTYEFVYDDLCLNILVDNNEDIELFNVVCKFLIEAVQDRIGNNNIEDRIDVFLYDDTISGWLIKEFIDNKISN